MENIEWRSVDGFCGLYEVSNSGLIRSLMYKTRSKSRVRLLKAGKDTNGYPRATLCGLGGFRRRAHVHRLVAEGFIPNPKCLPQVNHKNGKQDDNRVENLEWVSSQENIQHSFLTGTWHTRGKKTLTLDQVAEIRALINAGELKGKAIAVRYGVSQHTICNIRTGKSWSFLKPLNR